MLVWDIETSSIDILHRQYDLKVNINRFNPDEVVRDWNIFSVAWSYMDEEKVHCLSVSPRNPLNDYEVIRQFHSVLMEADVLIGHNSVAFDLKKFNTRAIYYKLPPIPKKQQIDTLKIARSIGKFTSNKLSYLCKYFGINAKDESPDWDKVIDGDIEEHYKMRGYNKNDVISSKELTKVLWPYIPNMPNLSVYSPVKDIEGKILLSCKACNSMNYRKAGFQYTNTGKKQRYICNNCGIWFSDGKLIK
jgi:hypothetical protein